MPLRIRLQRHGKKGTPFYWIVSTDSRANRDGKYLEKLGTYDPLANPAKVKLDVDSAVEWLQNGAQPSDTARSLLSSKGAMLKHHLLGGVRKGAFSEEEAEKRFQAWLEEKEGKLAERKEQHEKARGQAKAKALELEKEISAKREKATQPEEEQGDTAGETSEETNQGQDNPSAEKAEEGSKSDANDNKTTEE